jgi:hypothetical protein
MAEAVKDGGESVDVASLKARVEELEAQKNTWMGKATDYEKRFKGIDPEEFHANKTAIEALQREKALADPKQMEAWKSETEKQIRSSIQKELDETIGANKKLQAEMRELKVVDRVFKDVAGNFNEDCYDDVKEYIRKFCDLNDQGEIVIKDEKGNVRYAPGSTSKLMTASDFGNWLGEIRKSWKRPSHVSGTENGAPTRTTGTTGSITPQKFLSMTAEEKREAALKMKPEELQQIGRHVQQMIMGR